MYPGSALKSVLEMSKLQARHEVPGVMRKVAPSQRDD